MVLIKYVNTVEQECKPESEVFHHPGPRARHGSQRTRSQSDVQINSALPMHWCALRAEIPHRGTVRSRHPVLQEAFPSFARFCAILPIELWTLDSGLWTQDPRL